jgi:uncharacterized protein YodC (DUF2158 family)
MFPNGAVVILKSGGPAMTVMARRDDGLYEVNWFNNKDELKRGAFAEVELVAADVEEVMP